MAVVAGIDLGGTAINYTFCDEGTAEMNEAMLRWLLAEIRRGMTQQRLEQRNVALLVMPHGDIAGARGAALEARRHFKESGVQLH